MARTIYVSAGHGAGDPGAKSPDYPVTEAQLTLELRDLVYDRLAKHAFTVLRDGAEGVSESRHKSIAGARRADAAIEFHFNSFDRPATGVECFGLEGKEKLCKTLSAEVARILGLRLRGRAGYRHPSESQHPSLGFCSAGGVLLEVCFLFKRDLEPYFAKKVEVADAVAEAMKAYTEALDASASAPTRELRVGSDGRFRGRA